MALSDQELRAYTEELARLGVPEEFRDHLRRLRVLEEFGTPEQFRQVARVMGSLETIIRRNADLQEILDNQRFFVRIVKSIGEVAKYVAILLGGWLAYKAFVAEFISGVAK